MNDKQRYPLTWEGMFVMRSTLLAVSRKLIDVLRLRPETCRECGEVVSPWTDVCANCGVRGPVQVQKWIGYIIIGFTAQSFLL